MLSKIEEQKDVETEIEEDETFFDDEPSSTLRAKLQINEINEYVLSLKSAAKHWYNTFNPENNTDLSEKESILIDRLNRIGIGYFRPLIMSSFCNERVVDTDRIKLLEAMERFIFIAFRLSRAQSNYRNSSYYNSTRELFYGNININDIIIMIDNDLKWTNNEDGTYKYSYFGDFIYRKFKSGGTGFYGWNGLRYLLFEYEEELMKMRGVPKISWKNFIKSEKDKVSIEHIYPQTATDNSWTSSFSMYSETERKYLTGTLGNLLPLSASINSSLQNDSFKDKKFTKKDFEGNIIRNGYSNGSYSEQEVAENEVWSATEIKERGLKLLKFMEKRWNIKLGSKEDKLELLHISFLNPRLINEVISETQSIEE